MNTRGPRGGFRNVERRGREVWARLDGLRTRILARFAVDTRALAAFRITLGLTIIGDLLHRSRHIGLFYTDGGVYPRAVYEATFPRFTGLSLHALSGDLWFQALLFVIAGLVAVALVAGYRTRLAAIVSFVLLFSLHARNPAVLNGGDRLLRVLVLLSILVPMGERWSVDALRRGTARETVTSFGTAAVLVQPITIFSANAVLKHQGVTWYQGEAVQIALANDVMTVFLGNHLSEFPTLLTLLNYGWVVLLAGSSLFLLATVGRARAVAALAYIGAFVGMFLTLAVGVFPFALTAAVIPYLTAPFWDRLAEAVPSSLTERIPRSRLDRFDGRPIEHRLLDSLAGRGHESAADYLVAYGRSVLTVFGALALVWIVTFTAADVSGTSVPGEVNNPHLHDQRWGLYAPNPSESYSWYAVEARLNDSWTVDALGEGTVDRDRPPKAEREYPTFRHRKYMQSVRSSAIGDHREITVRSYAEWACRQAADRHDQGVKWVRVIRFTQASPVDGEYEPVREDHIYRHDCESTTEG